MASKPEAKPPAKVEAQKPASLKPHTSQPGTNPFVAQHPGKPGRAASGGDLGSRRNPR